MFSKNSSKNLTLQFDQKMQWMLGNTPLQNNTNIALLKKWWQYLNVPPALFSAAITQQRNCLTFSTQGKTVEVLESHANYYHQELGIAMTHLQRLETLGERWQPNTLGSWIELNTLGANAGWYVPVNLTATEILATFDEDSLNRRLFYRWTQYHPAFKCTQYGEDFSGAGIQQIELLFDVTQTLTTQYHHALALADLYKVNAFPTYLQEILEHYNTIQLALSLWLTPQGVVKFGLKVYQPSIKLMMALTMLTGLSKTDETSLALIHSSFDKIAWVEVQQVTEGLVTTLEFR